MREVPREWLEFMREQYPKGSRIRLIEMADDPHPLPEGSTGTLDHIDDAGHFHINWDNGRGLALVIGENRFSIQPPEPTPLKLYMPLTADFYPRNEWGDVEEVGEEWDGRTLLDYEDQIQGALIRNRMPEEKERGLMHWYDKQDSLNVKVRSAEFTAEEHGGQLWGVVECQIVGELSPEELDRLKDYITGQAADGWERAWIWNKSRWTAVSCTSICGTPMTAGASRRSRSGSPPSLRRACRRSASPPCRPPASSSASGGASPAATPPSGIPAIKSGTWSWRTS